MKEKDKKFMQRKYQEVRKLRREMFCNIKKLDRIENDIRELFEKP